MTLRLPKNLRFGYGFVSLHPKKEYPGRKQYGKPQQENQPRQKELPLPKCPDSVPEPLPPQYPEAVSPLSAQSLRRRKVFSAQKKFQGQCPFRGDFVQFNSGFPQGTQGSLRVGTDQLCPDNSRRPLPETHGVSLRSRDTVSIFPRISSCSRLIRVSTML